MDIETFPTKRRSGHRVAVIGSGISGLSAAWLLSRSADVVIYESDSRLGGHSNTVDFEQSGGSIPVDTGFIVFNEKNYPNLTAMFDHLGVETEASDMSFAASLSNGRFEYSGSGLNGLLGQRMNVVSPRFWTMLKGLLRFYRDAPALADRTDLDHMSLGDYLDQQGYSQSFIDDHLLPMGAAIWSTTANDMREYPLVAFIRFFVNHGLVNLKGRPQWRTVTGGSRRYVQRIAEAFPGEIRLSTPVQRIERLGASGVRVHTAGGHSEVFDDVVLACHADQALGMLADADTLESDLLGAFQYTSNLAVLHSDTDLMPKRKSVWSSWNYIGGGRSREDQALCVSYWMNRLQNLPTKTDLFVTLNPSRRIAPSKVAASFDYTHPLFDTKALAAQRSLWQLQGRRGTWFCGAYFGSGFHEDGLQSGLAVAETLGGVRRPWEVRNESGRIHLGQALAAAE